MSDRVGWLIDDDMFESYREELVSAIRSQGHVVKMIHAPSPPYRWDDVGCSYRDTFSRDACVIVVGDIELATRIHKERRWLPGAFCTVENFACSSYFCRFGKYLLNGDYIMLPFGELARQRSFLFRTLGSESRFFVRPDSPLKLFTGQNVTEATFDRDLEYLAFYDFPPSSMVVVSSPKRIVAEWRFVVADHCVIAGSRYKRDDVVSIDSDVDPSAAKLAAVIAAQDYEPDPVWVLDVCKTAEGDYRLLEIGGFSFADLYACDKGDIVRAVSDVALRIWRAGDPTAND